MLRYHFSLVPLFILIGIILGALLYSLGAPGQNKDIASYTISEMHACYKSNMSGQCYRELAVNLLDKYKLGEILLVLEKDVQQKRSINLESCHTITHYLGREAYKRSNNIQETFKQCTQICLTGCYHGAIEERLVKNNLSIDDDAAISREIRSLCGKQNSYDRLIEFQECLHGLGHGLMFLTENDLPRSLRICEALDTEYERDRCQNGAFMENHNSLQNKEHPSKFVKADDPSYPCNILDKKYLDNCYIYQSFRLKEIGKNDWKKIFELCYTFPKDYWYQCFRSLGGYQVSNNSTMEAMKANCGFISNTYYRNICIGGVAEIFSHHFNGDFSATIKFCSIVDRENKTYCYTKMGQDIKKWTRNRNEMISICSKISEEEYQDKCISATRQ